MNTKHSDPTNMWPDLLADEVEGVDISGSTQQTLIKDDHKRQPGAGQEKETDCQQEQHCIHHLKGAYRRFDVSLDMK